MISKGVCNSFDGSAYFLKLDKKDHVYLLPYVDGMLLISKEIRQINKLQLLSQSEFDIKDLNPGKKTLGMEIKREKFSE